MVKHGIKIYARVKPSKKAAGCYELEETEDDTPKLSFTIPKSEASGHINNKKEIYAFRFNAIFDQKAKQDEVFHGVAKSVIDNCLEGYNGTIFAYGQTGSGKTFTITGGAEHYNERGIIPRSLSYIFKYFQENPEKIFTVHVSYLEIYNENGYDLLDPRHEASKLEDLPKVHIRESADGAMIMKNLSMQPSTNEEEALNWLFLGDTNRMIAETPMNMASTRSHCIFTVYLTIREPGADVIRKSKLHLVDLAGSERIGKTGVGGTLLTEAKYINLSLHFLEQVIVALSEKSRSHIPYRNSMMTSVLRDSLGGNCMTSMVATCSIEKGNIDESISTCRFAQRVALIKNDAMLNEELDPKLMVVRLKQQVKELKDELALATGEERQEELTEEECQQCCQLVDQYVAAKSADVKLSIGSDMRKIQYCFRLLKVKILEMLESPNQSLNGMRSTVEKQSFEKEGHSDEEWQKMTTLLKQRDDEINILVKMLKKEKKRASESEAALIQLKAAPPASPSDTSSKVADCVFSLGGPARMKMEDKEEDNPILQRGNQLRDGSAGSEVSTLAGQKRAALKAELSKARQEAFDTFRREYAHDSAIDQQKRQLKANYAEAKALGERVNTSRMMINQLKSQIEKVRISRAVTGLVDGDSMLDTDEREDHLRRQMEEEKLKFKDLYHNLKDMKSEIEHSQHLLEKAKVQLQKDFEVWWEKEAKKTKSAKRPHSSSRKVSEVSSSSTDPLRSASPLDPLLAKPTDHSPHVTSQVLPAQQDRTSTPKGLSVPFFSGQGTQSVSLRDSILSRPTEGTFNKLESLKASLSDPYSSKSPSMATRIKSPGSIQNSVSDGPSKSPGSIQLTGDRKADADILAFYRARQKLIERGLKRTS